MFFSNFWTPRVWLPEGYDWKDLAPTKDIQYPVWNDLWTYPIAMAFAAIALRYLILNPFIFGPIANYFGLRQCNTRKLPANSNLDELFKAYKSKPPQKLLEMYANKVGWSCRKVERWLRVRTASSKEGKYKKFVECSWQLLYYTSIFCYGFIVMWDKNWMFDIDACWIGYPKHSVNNDLWWYYMISLAFYWSMVFTHFFETKRKDFWQMFIHHLVTIALIIFSWTCNLCRIGAVILVTHDCADIPLQLAKMGIYLKKKTFCDISFAVFALMWFLSRDIYFPVMVIRNTLFYATDIIPIFPAYYIFNALLIALFALHLVWTYFIFMMVINTAIKGKVEDERSSSEESYSDDDYDWNSEGEDHELIPNGNSHTGLINNYGSISENGTSLKARKIEKNGPEHKEIS